MCGICWWLNHIHHWPKDKAIEHVHCIHGDNFERCQCGVHMFKCQHGIWVNKCHSGCYSKYKDIPKGEGWEKRPIPPRDFYIPK